MNKIVKNRINREVPLNIGEFKNLKPFDGAFNHTPLIKKDKGNRSLPKLNKIINTIEEVIALSGLTDGMTISFHHHFRNGDLVIKQVMDVIANLKVKNLTLASSSLTSCHDFLIDHINNGVISQIYTSGLRGELAKQISYGLMQNPVIIHSHGGRARAIETGKIKIDVAFLGVPACDVYGNANGFSGKSRCGSLGYAIEDAKYARKVVLLTDEMVEYPNTPFSIHQDQVDYIVKVDQIGEPEKISTGATRITKNPHDLLLAQLAANVIIKSGYFENDFSLQTGSGGASLATTRYLKEEMQKKEITASFALGGITAQMVELYDAGLIRRLMDVQSFDQIAIDSIGKNRYHQEISASFYANPLNKGCIVNKLNVVILSALEVDTDFNVNVITGCDGVIMGASGGHSDTAIGAGISIIIAPLLRGRTATIVKRVNNVITPGESVDVVVTDRGIAVNPGRRDIYEQLKKAHLPLYSIEELRQIAEKIAGVPEPIQFEKRIIGLIEYRDGTIIDIIRQVKD